MNLLLKLILTLSAFLLLGFATNAQTVNASLVKEDATKKCEPTNCNPEACKKLVEAGICTPEQVSQCQVKGTTKVASQKMVAEELVEAIKTLAEPTNVKTEEKVTDCCAPAGCLKKT